MRRVINGRETESKSESEMKSGQGEKGQSGKGKRNCRIGTAENSNFRFRWSHACLSTDTCTHVHCACVCVCVCAVNLKCFFNKIKIVTCKPSGNVPRDGRLPGKHIMIRVVNCIVLQLELGVPKVLASSFPKRGLGPKWWLPLCCCSIRT